MIIDKIITWDKSITLYINHLGSNWLDSFMIMMSNRQVWYPLYLAIIIFLFYRLGWKKALLCFLGIILTVGLCDQTSYWFKHWFGRLRPCYDYYMLSHNVNLLEGRTSYFGFFSAHAANSFGIAVASIMAFANDKFHKYSKFNFFIILWAILVSISRIFVGKHYLGDIIVGASFGILYGYYVEKFIRFLINRFIDTD